MADTVFRNVINGELVDSASGESYDVVDPTTGEVYATRAAAERARDAIVALLPEVALL